MDLHQDNTPLYAVLWEHCGITFLLPYLHPFPMAFLHLKKKAIFLQPQLQVSFFHSSLYLYIEQTGLQERLSN